MRSQLRKRLFEEFELHVTPANTRITYACCIDRFERHFGVSAAKLGKKQVREFLLHLVAVERVGETIGVRIACAGRRLAAALDFAARPHGPDRVSGSLGRSRSRVSPASLRTATPTEPRGLTSAPA
jgi:hypothetical protein